MIFYIYSKATQKLYEQDIKPAAGEEKAEPQGALYSKYFKWQ